MFLSNDEMACEEGARPVLGHRGCGSGQSRLPLLPLLRTRFSLESTHFCYSTVHSEIPLCSIGEHHSCFFTIMTTVVTPMLPCRHPRRAQQSPRKATMMPTTLMKNTSTMLGLTHPYYAPLARQEDYCVPGCLARYWVLHETRVVMPWISIPHQAASICWPAVELFTCPSRRLLPPAMDP